MAPKEHVSRADTQKPHTGISAFPNDPFPWPRDHIHSLA